MRKIKFRAWNGFRQEMNEVLNIGWFEGIYMNISVDTEEGQLDYNDSLDNMECDNIELMQYTGLHDKNGKEIYEGDIVKVLINGIWYKGQVIYEHSGFTIDVTSNKQLEFERIGIIERFTEIIGNIHDNPKLLEVE